MYGDFGHTVPLLHAMSGMLKQIFEYTQQVGCSMGRNSQNLFIRLKISARISAVLTDEALAAGEVSKLV